MTLGPLGNLQAERPLTIRERVRGANGYLRVETRAGLDATVLLSTDLRSWNSLRTLKLEPGMNEVAVPETQSDAEFLRLVW